MLELTDNEGRPNTFVKILRCRRSGNGCDVLESGSLAWVHVRESYDYVVSKLYGINAEETHYIEELRDGIRQNFS